MEETKEKTAKKDWLTLNAHGKRCLKNYLSALSASDVLTTQMDYLNKKGLIDYKSNFPDWKKRSPVSIECLTDLGLATAKHYFPQYK